MFWLQTAIDPIKRHIVFVEHNKLQWNLQWLNEAPLSKLFFVKFKLLAGLLDLAGGDAFKRLQVKQLRFLIKIFARDQLYSTSSYMEPLVSVTFHYVGSRVLTIFPADMTAGCLAYWIEYFLQTGRKGVAVSTKCRKIVEREKMHRFGWWIIIPGDVFPQSLEPWV